VKLDKRHMGISLVLLAGSVVYNVWVFSGSGTTTRTPQPAGPIETQPSGQPTSGGVGAIDPAQVTALPDVALDRAPEWPRNPFQNVRLPVEVVQVEEAAAPAPVPEADPVVGTILYSPDRRAAVVDGHVVRIGGTIGTSTVVDILPRAVIIESPERGRRTLELKPATGAAGRK
jgi:hypothetical protein